MAWPSDHQARLGVLKSERRGSDGVPALTGQGCVCMDTGQLEGSTAENLCLEISPKARRSIVPWQGDQLNASYAQVPALPPLRMRSSGYGGLTRRKQGRAAMEET